MQPGKNEQQHYQYNGRSLIPMLWKLVMVQSQVPIIIDVSSWDKKKKSEEQHLITFNNITIQEITKIEFNVGLCFLIYFHLNELQSTH